MVIVDGLLVHIVNLDGFTDTGVVMIPDATLLLGASHALETLWLAGCPAYYNDLRRALEPMEGYTIEVESNPSMYLQGTRVTWQKDTTLEEALANRSETRASFRRTEKLRKNLEHKPTN